MPYVYTGLSFALWILVMTKLVYFRRGTLTPPSVSVAIIILLSLEAISISMLALLTGPYPIMSIDTYRPVVVSLRGAMLPIAVSCDYVMLSALWRARR